MLVILNKKIVFFPVACGGQPVRGSVTRLCGFPQNLRILKVSCGKFLKFFFSKSAKFADFKGFLFSNLRIFNFFLADFDQNPLVTLIDLANSHILHAEGIRPERVVVDGDVVRGDVERHRLVPRPDVADSAPVHSVSQAGG